MGVDLGDCLSVLQSGRLLIAIVALIIISFYSGTLFGGRRLVYTVQTPGAAADDGFPHKISEDPRPLAGLQILKNMAGMHVCPLRYAEYIPCHDRLFSRTLPGSLDLVRKQDLERHCPPSKARPFCLVPPPKGYRLPMRWPKSRDFVWRSNVNHSKLAEVKGGQNWVHENGTKWWFPGGGTHYKHGASEYIGRLGNMITGGKGTLKSAGVYQVLDVGCGVGSFSAYLLPLGITTMSFAPQDEHENQVQFALERGILAMLSVLATTRLPYSSKSFDLIHCSRCRVDWHLFDGILLKEVDRLLRVKGYFVYSAPPAYRSDKDFPQQWRAILNFTSLMCWELIAQEIQTAIWQKTSNLSCLLKHSKEAPLLCKDDNNADRAWYEPMKNCIYLSQEIKLAPLTSRLWIVPQRLSDLNLESTQFEADTLFWKEQTEFYWSLLEVPDEHIRNVMDMNAYFGGFAAALIDKALWVMNVVPAGGKNTLPIIYDRGLMGTFHDWCEPFSTYPRTYDLLHAFRVLSIKHKACNLLDILLEMDRMLRPLGVLIIRDSRSVVQEAAALASKFLWNGTVHNIYVNGEEHPREQVLICHKQFWVIA